MIDIRITRIDNRRGLIGRRVIRRATDTRVFRGTLCPARGTIPIVNGVSIVGFDDFQDVRRPNFRGPYGIYRDFVAP
jgi:hypothetical protein